MLIGDLKPCPKHITYPGPAGVKKLSSGTLHMPIPEGSNLAMYVTLATGRVCEDKLPNPIDNVYII